MEKARQEGEGDWPPQGSSIELPEGEFRRGSTGQLFVVKNGRWERVREPNEKAD